MMMLLSPLVFALAVTANPITAQESHVTLQLSRQFNSTGLRNILRHDQARAHQLKDKSTTKLPQFHPVSNEPVLNNGVIYTANVGVGSPTTFYSLIVDTGSSNTWLGAGKAYVQTNTSRQTGDSVVVSYASGFLEGLEYIDTLTVGSVVITNQSIGVATNAFGFGGVDGILGIGPANLTVGSLYPNASTAIPTVMDNAFREKKINACEIGISFEPAASSSVQNGELSWGGVDRSKYTGEIHFAPVTSTFPASSHWGIEESITYGATTILHKTAGIVDTATTLILIATEAFNRYQNATGSVLDETSGLLKITSSQYYNLKTLKFHINGVIYYLTPNGQIWPRSLNGAIGGTAGSIYLVVNDIGSNSGQGMDFVNGYTFLERFYSVFDTTNKRVGLATTRFTNALIN